MSWWRTHWRWLLALLVSGLAIGAIVVLYLARRQKQLADLQAALAFMQAGAKVAGLQAEGKARAVELEKNDVAKKQLDKQIADAKRVAVATVASVEKMSDEEVAAEFAKLGY